MSLCSVHSVAKARKDPGTCVVCRRPIKAGDPYQYWEGRYTSRKVACGHHGTIPLHLRETNPLRSEWYVAEEEVLNAQNEADPAKAAEYLRSAIDTVQGIVSDLQERIDAWSGTNLENSVMYQAHEESLSSLEDWVSSAEEVANELEGIEEAPEEDGTDEAADAIQEWEDSVEDALSGLEELPELDLGA